MMRRMPSQTWEPQGYMQHAGFVPELGDEILSWLAPQAGEAILDVGCGEGALTARIAEAGAHVLGIDSSTGMVEAARARGLEAHVVDATALDPHDVVGTQAFDAIFSNAALHWMRPPGDVVRGVAKVLRPGGRFVAELGGHGNVAAIRVALAAALDRRGIDARALDPWYFPTPDEYGTLVEAHGLRVERVALVARPTPLPTDMAGWLNTFARVFLEALPTGERHAVTEGTMDRLRPVLCDTSGRWTADYVRLRILARKG
jgi:SAM-dependent methyltransferase